MPEVAQRPAMPAVTNDTLPIPQAFPSVPKEVIKRFPEAKQWDDDIQQMWRKLNRALRDMNVGNGEVQQKVQSFSQSIHFVSETGNADVTTEIIARQDGDNLLAGLITTVTARLNTGDIATAISALTAQAGPGGVLASDIITLTARLNTGDIATAISSLQAFAGPGGTSATQITTLTARLNTGDIATAISSLQAYAGPGGTTATALTALTATVGTNTANIISESTARATADSALSSTITTLSATVTSNNTAVNAAITSEASARATADGAISTTLSSLSATVTTNNSTLSAAITSEATARASADSAMASTIASLVAGGGNLIFVQASTSVPVAAHPNDIWYQTDNNLKPFYWNSTTSTWDDASDTRITVNAAAITTEQTARIVQDGVLATNISTTLAVANGAVSAVSTEATARATADGFLQGKYTLTVVAGNVVTGMNITSSTGTGTPVSDVTFQASSFKVYNGATGVAPFQISGGVVRITGSLIVQPSDIQGTAVVTGGTAADINSHTTTIDGGRITAFSVTASQLAVIPANLARDPYFTAGAVWLVGDPHGNAQLASIASTSASIGWYAGTGGTGTNDIQAPGTAVLWSGRGAWDTTAQQVITTPIGTKTAIVSENTVYEFGITCNNTSNHVFHWRIDFYTSTGAGISSSIALTFPAGSGRTQQKAQVTSPAGAMQAVFTGYNDVSGAFAGALIISQILFREAGTATMFVDGTITAAKLVAHTLTTNELNFTPVQDSNVIASINASAEGGGTLRISASKIHINGSVQFDAGFDPSGKADTTYVNTQVAGRVAAGGAAADVNANVTTINGSMITTGTIIANRLSISNLADIVGVLQVGTGGGVVRIDSTQMVYGYGSGFGTVNFTNNGTNQVGVTVGSVYGVQMYGGSAAGVIRVGTLSGPPAGIFTDTYVDVLSEFRIGGVKVVGARGASVSLPSSTGGTTGIWSNDLSHWITWAADLQSRIISHGLISP